MRLVGRERDNSAERKDETVHIPAWAARFCVAKPGVLGAHALHVQVVCSNGVGDGVARHELRLFGGKAGHILRIDLQGLVAKLCVPQRRSVAGVGAQT